MGGIYKIRPMVDGDAPIVFDSWSNALADELEITEQDGRRAFRRAQIPVLKQIVARGMVLVAVTTRDDSAVLGWVCTEGETLHFVFTKKDFRRMGICRALVKAANLPAETRASHATHWGFPRVARLFTKLIHDPTLGVPK